MTNAILLMDITSICFSPRRLGIQRRLPPKLCRFFSLLFHTGARRIDCTVLRLESLSNVKVFPSMRIFFILGNLLAQPFSRLPSSISHLFIYFHSTVVVGPLHLCVRPSTTGIRGISSCEADRSRLKYRLRQ